MITAELDAEVRRVEAAVAPLPAYRREAFAWTLAWTLLVPAAVYVLTFAAACSGSPRFGLRSLGLSKFGPVLDYGYEVKRVDADVVIFGDSSAFLGVDPRLLDARLNLRTVVLPNTIGSLPVAGDLVLRRYLEHNRRPRLLVLYFSAWNLDYAGAAPKEFLLEGEEEMLRYGTWPDIRHAVSQYPRQFMVFPFQSLEPLGLKHFRRALKHEGADRGTDTALAFGHWDYTLPYPALTAQCRLRAAYTERMSHNTVQALRRRYEAEGMPVAVYLAPIPACENAAPLLMQSYTDVGAAPPVAEPAAWFADDSFTAHIRPEYVRQNSTLFASWLRELPDH